MPGLLSGISGSIVKFHTWKVIYDNSFTSDVSFTNFDLSTLGVPSNALAAIIVLVMGSIAPQPSDFYARMRVRETGSGLNTSCDKYVTCPAALGNPEWSNLVQALPLYGSLIIQYQLESDIPTVSKDVEIGLIGYIV